MVQTGSREGSQWEPQAPPLSGAPSSMNPPLPFSGQAPSEVTLCGKCFLKVCHAGKQPAAFSHVSRAGKGPALWGVGSHNWPGQASPASWTSSPLTVESPPSLGNVHPGWFFCLRGKQSVGLRPPHISGRPTFAQPRLGKSIRSS